MQLLRKLSDYAEPGALRSIWLPTREGMGAMLNMTFENASRVVSSLRREGVLLEVQSRQALLDFVALEQATDAVDAD